MATTYNPSEVKAPANQYSPVPAGEYMVQITKIEQNPSKSGNCMDKVTFEILAPDTVEHEGAVVTTAGRPGEFYIVYGENTMHNALQMLKALGMEITHPFTLPDANEVNSGQLTKVVGIQDYTPRMIGGRFTIRLASERIAETPKPTDPDFNPKLDRYKQLPRRNPDNTVRYLDLHRLGNINAKDITAPISNIDVSVTADA